VPAGMASGEVPLLVIEMSVIGWLRS
jgi:hypothetical protein